MAVTEVQETSYFARLGGAIKGVFTGIILFIVAFPLLFWNEGRAVKRAQTLAAGASSVISVESDKVLPENEGKLVHVSGKLVSDATLTDPEFGISVKGIRLIRKVEMYQWSEKSSSKTEKKLGGGEKKTTVYTYEKAWSDKLIPSAGFKEAGHDNPDNFPFAAQKWQAGDVKLGAFQLPENMIGMIGQSKPHELPADYQLTGGRQGYVRDNVIYIYHVPGKQPQDDSPAVERASGTQEIGDVRVTYASVVPHDVSVVAKQQGQTFSPYTVKDGTILLMTDSLKSADAMFQSAQKSNSVMTWILRIAGFLLMYIGLGMVLRPLSVLADVIPLVGDLIGAGVSLVSFLIAMPCTLFTIAVAWLFYRPLIAVPLIVIGIAGLVFLIRKRSEAKKRKAAAAAA
mgnify:FL=1